VLASGFNLNWINISANLLSTPRIDNLQVIVYPNPTARLVNYTGDDFQEFDLFSQQGSKVLSGGISKEGIIHLGKRSLGDYLLRLRNLQSGEIFSQRLLIQN
jgi:hypothetical protein